MASTKSGLFGGLLAVAIGLAGAAASAQETHPILSRIKLPPGFKISIFAEVPKARSLVVGKPLSTIFVGSRHGTIHSLRDTDLDGIADEVLKRADGLKVPNGIAYLNSQLYVVQQDRVSFWPVPAEFDTSLPIEPLIDIKTDLPDKFLHGWRYAKFGPDNKLYVGIGSPCNICEPQGLEGSIIRMSPDGSDVETIARGVRNSVGFDWHPVTNELFFTDKGADGMGDDIPPDELNHVTTLGRHYGFPFLGGKSVKLTGFEDKEAPADAVAPVVEFQAHSANLGIHFYRGGMFPAEYRNDAFVAQHGSWNRTEPVGYQIMRVRFEENGKAVDKEVFAEGWLKEGAAVGRPVDITELADGSLLVSDDFAGLIYRISYGE
ncbi:MAG: PQQ-dependent sugar dehydrogenase [Hyphomicrobiales bacterium]|nr:PQQ-dependent sugar dehydrogenase [Hyphomicrobiales bacterium]